MSEFDAIQDLDNLLEVEEHNSYRPENVDSTESKDFNLLNATGIVA